jgi:membrane glycosyltransferase
MERNPGVGIIQTVPRLVNGETIFARLQQFASRLYGPVFASGLNYWQQGEANYWGHNAIIRVAPFIEHCSLPELPGIEPFGGRILSHDYVEAALMRRAGWSVWLAVDIEGSYEECPGNLIDFAKRDRRWLQGNLQHAWLLTARGLHAANRLHLALGILAYLASPLWLAFLVVSSVIAWRYASTGLSPLPVDSFAKYLRLGFGSQALLLLAATLGLLFLPKILALLDLVRRPGAAAQFGGWLRVIASVIGETLIFTLLAPVLMLFHSKFIFLTLAGRGVAWVTQRRGADGDPEWREAILTQLTHLRQAEARKQVGTFSPMPLPQRLWEKLIEAAGIPATTPWACTKGSARPRTTDPSGRWSVRLPWPCWARPTFSALPTSPPCSRTSGSGATWCWPPAKLRWLSKPKRPNAQKPTGVTKKVLASS